MRQRAVIQPPIDFHPSAMGRILIKVLRRDVVMLAGDHPAKAREVGLSLIGRNAVEVRIGLRVVDAEGLEGQMQRIPMGGIAAVSIGAEL
jgi:hypothetical protein